MLVLSVPSVGKNVLFALLRESLFVRFTPVRGTLITEIQNDSLTWRKQAKSKNNCFWKTKGLKLCQHGFSIL